MTDEERLIDINRIIFAVGAPLGSEEYFAIREHCAAVLRRTRCTITHTPPVENYWTTGADDDQSRCTITQTAKPAVLLHAQQQEQFEQFARKYIRKPGPFLRSCGLIDSPYTYADPDIEAAWEDWKKLK